MFNLFLRREEEVFNVVDIFKNYHFILIQKFNWELEIETTESNIHFIPN